MWAVTVGTNMAGRPGRRPRRALRIAGRRTPSARRRVLRYVLHCLALPLILIVFCLVHFWRVRKDGGISGPL